MEYFQKKAALVADSLGRQAQSTNSRNFPNARPDLEPWFSQAERGIEWSNRAVESIESSIKEDDEMKAYWEEEVVARVDEITGNAKLSAADLARVRPLESWTSGIHEAVAKLRLAGQSGPHRSLLHTTFQTAVRRVPAYPQDGDIV